MKTLKFLLINLFIRDHRKTLEIINGLDDSKNIESSELKCPDYIGDYLLCDNFEIEIPLVKSENKIKADNSTQVKPKTKKDELLQALNYLKSKKEKKKQDKESIYTLELLLKNMK
jgi:hypothetical protein